MEQLSPQYTAIQNPYISQQSKYTMPALPFPQLSQQDAQQLASQIAPHLRLKENTLSQVLKKQPLFCIGSILAFGPSVLKTLGARLIQNGNLKLTLNLISLVGSSMVGFDLVRKFSSSMEKETALESILKISSK